MKFWDLFYKSDLFNQEWFTTAEVDVKPPLAKIFKSTDARKVLLKKSYLDHSILPYKN